MIGSIECMNLFGRSYPVIRLILFLLVLCISGCDTQDPQQDPQSFYRDNVLRIIVGVNPGGGFDEYARMVAAAQRISFDLLD